MLDLENVKRKIRGLLNLAANDGAADGEIRAAMELATKLMDDYQLERADIEAAQEPAARASGRFADVAVDSHRTSLTQWEITLSAAISKLVGTVSHFRDRKRVEKGPFNRLVTVSFMVYYGPEEDVAIAKELHDEWRCIIATMATGKYGGCCQNAGARYAYGFACALYGQAKAAERARCTVVTESTSALVHVGASLAQVLDQVKQEGTKWLEKARGIKLVNRSGRVGYSGGDMDAYSRGRSDGARASFTANRKSKLGAGSQARLPG